MADVQDRDAMAAQRRAEEAQCLKMNERMMTPCDRAKRALAQIKSEGGSPEMAVYRAALLDVATKQANATREEFVSLAAAADAAGRGMGRVSHPAPLIPGGYPALQDWRYYP